MFAGPYIKDGAEIFANIIINDLRNKINKQLNYRFAIAKENYYHEIENIQKRIDFLINNLKNDFKGSLLSEIDNLKFQRKVAFDLGYKKPVSTDVLLMEDSFANGYIYLDKRIKDLESTVKKLRAEIKELKNG